MMKRVWLWSFLFGHFFPIHGKSWTSIILSISAHKVSSGSLDFFQQTWWINITIGITMCNHDETSLVMKFLIWYFFFLIHGKSWTLIILLISAHKVSSGSLDFFQQTWWINITIGITMCNHDETRRNAFPAAKMQKKVFSKQWRATTLPHRKSFQLPRRQ